MANIFAKWARATHASAAAYDVRRLLMAAIRRIVGRVLGDDADEALQEMWSQYQACCAQVMAGGSVLDVGCGPGEHSSEVLGLWQAIRYAGVDVSVGMVVDAKRRYPSLSFIAADSCLLPLPDRSFDVVTSSFIFHHIPVAARSEALREQLRVGKVVLLRDLFGMDGGPVALLYRLYYLVFDGSEHRFTVQEWRDFVKAAGAEIVVEGYSHPDVVRNRHCFFLIRQTA